MNRFVVHMCDNFSFRSGRVSCGYLHSYIFFLEMCRAFYYLTLYLPPAVLF